MERLSRQGVEMYLRGHGLQRHGERVGMQRRGWVMETSRDETVMDEQVGMETIQMWTAFGRDLHEIRHTTMKA